MEEELSAESSIPRTLLGGTTPMVFDRNPQPEFSAVWAELIVLCQTFILVYFYLTTILRSIILMLVGIVNHII